MNHKAKKNRQLRRLRQRRASRRRGILLLVVLSLLTLFLLVGTAFILSATNFRDAQKTSSRAAVAANSAIHQDFLLDEVLGQLVRDTNNERSAMRFHSLLRDMYGSDGVDIGPQNINYPHVEFAPRVNFEYTYTTPGGPVTLDWNDLDQRMDNTVTGTGSQFFWVAVQYPIYDATNNPTGYPIELMPISQVDNYYNGSTFTFTSGELEGITCRIIKYDFEDNSAINGYAYGVFTLMPLNNVNSFSSSDITDLAGSNPWVTPDTRAVINGRPFNGTGVGFNPTPPASATSALLTFQESTRPATGSASYPVALMPNAAFMFENLFTVPIPTLSRNYYINDNEWDYIPPTYPGGEWPDPTLSDDQRNYYASFFRKRGLGGLGGSDESYDAPDFQNMALALMPRDPGEIANSTTALVDINGKQLVLPSFHRPALLNYWNSQIPTIGTDPANASLLRKVLMRPSWFDHPKFTGSNPEFAFNLSQFATTPGLLINQMIYGPWDVDNDKDGIRDSVWIDAGLPLVTAPDGKLLKPLAAMLVVDMDGRLNVNAHGSAEHLRPLGVGTPESDLLAGDASSESVPRGQGYGPADIRLDAVLSNTTVNSLFAGLAGLYPGKYGAESSDNSLTVAETRRPGHSGSFDARMRLQSQGYPMYRGLFVDRGTVFATLPEIAPRSLFTTAPDMLCRYAMPALNQLGQLIDESVTASGETDEIGNDPVFLDQDSPYELDLSRTATWGVNYDRPDAPFSPAELERMLRPFDADAPALAPRLWDLLRGAAGSAPSTQPTLDQVKAWSKLLTTASYDLPTPGVAAPRWALLGPDDAVGGNDSYAEVMNAPPTNLTFSSLLEYRLRVQLNYPKSEDTVNPNQLQEIQTHLNVLLPQEIAAGLRLDVNRPLGNGLDDNGNGVVDEPGELDGGREPASWQFNTAAREKSPAGKFPAAMDAFVNQNTAAYRDAVDRNGDGVIERFERGDYLPDNNTNGLADSGDGDDTINDIERVARDNYRRQLLARDLYVMAMTLTDPFDLATDEGKAKCRKLAQWAINVVDFRDPDGIMTAFEYDENPFKGWTADGIITDTPQPGTGVVWGAERPELVMTETLAWHDRRTSDENDEDVAGEEEERGTVGSGKDTDYDQSERPRGAAFIELYNPWPQNSAAGADLHVFDNDGNDMGVNLAAVAGNTPVWRMVVAKDSDGTPVKDPDDPETNKRPTDIERSVYFAGDALDYSSLPDDGVPYFNLTANAVPPVRPGRYMVVGSGDETASGSGIYETPIGKLNWNAATPAASSRAIVLNRQPTANSPSVYVREKDGEDTRVEDVTGYELESPLEQDIQTAFNNGNGAVAVSPLLGDTSVCISDVAIIDRTAAGRRRFNVTEPRTGYPENVGGSSYYAAGGYYAAARDVRTGVPNPARLPVDVPLDNNRSDGETRLRVDAGTDEQDRTIPAFCWVYLQRLANPMLAHDPVTNPYKTIDAMSMNVTVFNGAWEDEQIEGKRFNNAYATETFASLQRGRNNNVLQGPIPNVARPQTPNEIQQLFLRPGRSPHQQEPTQNGILANNLWTVEHMGVWKNRGGERGDGIGELVNAATASHFFNAVPDCTLGFLNEPFQYDAGGALGNADLELRQRVEPQQPYAMLTWNDRPYVSDTELLQVPAARSSELTLSFSMPIDPATPQVPKPEVYGGTATPPPGAPNLRSDGAFGHLLNFFRTDDQNDASGIAGMYRVLEFLQTPSRYVGTQNWLNPLNFGSNPATYVTDPRYGLQPPFNKISEYRDPGKVNLNTIPDEMVYNGIMHNVGGATAHAGPRWEDLVNNRRGYNVPGRAGAGVQVMGLNASTPSFFANPIRANGAGRFVPLGDMVREDVDSSMLRSNLVGGLTEATDTAPAIFAASGTGAIYANPSRNSYHRYAPISRLANLTTTRSNVYAVWITIGFFEVEEFDVNTSPPNPLHVGVLKHFGTGLGTLDDAMADPLFQRVYPDGYMITKEAGSDTGQIQRLREFAIVDRSIPVAFEPGEDHNSREAVVVKRRIE